MVSYNSSKQRTGAPIASHKDSNRHVVEKDFSPPERVRVFRPSLLIRVESGSTWAIFNAENDEKCWAVILRLNPVSFLDDLPLVFHDNSVQSTGSRTVFSRGQ